MKHLLSVLFVGAVVNVLFINRRVWWAWVLVVVFGYLAL